jgi:hypothetical protein
MAVSSNLRVLKPGAPFSSVQDFDDCLIRTLQSLANGVLINCTNVTYPMKTLLLLTGLMPAFDSQVKGGLTKAGFTGVKSTSFKLPVQGSTNAKKICALPFYIADCANNTANVAAINAAISASNFPNLSNNIGRIFDVLLFSQNSSSTNNLLLNFIPPIGITRWYSI